MDNKSEELLREIYEYLNNQFFENDGVQILAKDIHPDGVSVIFFTYDNRFKESKDGKIIQVKDNMTSIYTYFDEIIKEIKIFNYKNFKSKNSVDIYVDFIVINNYKCVIIYE